MVSKRCRHSHRAAEPLSQCCRQKRPEMRASLGLGGSLPTLTAEKRCDLERRAPLGHLRCSAVSAGLSAGMVGVRPVSGGAGTVDCRRCPRKVSAAALALALAVTRSLRLALLQCAPQRLTAC